MADEAGLERVLVTNLLCRRCKRQWTWVGEGGKNCIDFRSGVKGSSAMEFVEVCYY
jgi:hypothetical protein